MHELRIKKTSRNGNHVTQWTNTLNKYASPIIGKKPVDLNRRTDIKEIFEPIWLTKQETARRVLQRLGVVFDYALLHEFRKNGNPVSGVQRGLGSRLGRASLHLQLAKVQARDWIPRLALYDPYHYQVKRCAENPLGRV